MGRYIEQRPARNRLRGEYFPGAQLGQFDPASIALIASFAAKAGVPTGLLQKFLQKDPRIAADNITMQKFLDVLTQVGTAAQQDVQGRKSGTGGLPPDQLEALAAQLEAAAAEAQANFQAPGHFQNNPAFAQAAQIVTNLRKRAARDRGKGGIIPGVSGILPWLIGAGLTYLMFRS